MVASRVAPGQTLEGRFVVLDRIAQGGMATVFKARDLERDGSPVAVKVPLPQFASGLGSWSMLQREAEIGLALDHPAIVRFVPLPPDKHRNYVVTEFVEGQTLAARIRAGRLDGAETVRIMTQLCEAVETMHSKGFVHYDLKPANVILCADGSIRLIDLGLAHAVVTSRFDLGAAAPAIGTSDYVAPEQIGRQRGRRSVDIYALGSMLYEMLTGRAPFQGDDPFVLASARRIGDPKPPRSLVPDLSTQLEEIVLRALRRDPTERYATVAALQRDLQDPSRVSVSGLAERLVPVTAFRKALWIARSVAIVGVAPVASLVALFGVLWWYLAHKH